MAHLREWDHHIAFAKYIFPQMINKAVTALQVNLSLTQSKSTDSTAQLESDQQCWIYAEAEEV